MKKLLLRWLGMIIFVAILSAVMIRLGEWQLHRLHARRTTNAQVIAFQKQPVRPYEQVLQPGRTITDADQWQRVSVTGTYDAAHQLQAMFRSQGDDHGSEVVTPMRTTRGEWVLVDRGFLVRAQNGNEDAVMPAPPKGSVTVVGYVRRSERGATDAITPNGGVVRLINAPAISAALPYRVLDGYVGAISSTPAQSGNLQPMQTPELTEGPHLSYAVQWFCFTATAIVGAGILIRGDVQDRKRAKARAERRAAAEQSGTEPERTDPAGPIAGAQTVAGPVATAEPGAAAAPGTAVEPSGASAPVRKKPLTRAERKALVEQETQRALQVQREIAEQRAAALAGTATAQQHLGASMGADTHQEDNDGSRA